MGGYISYLLVFIYFILSVTFSVKPYRIHIYNKQTKILYYDNTKKRHINSHSGSEMKKTYISLGNEGSKWQIKLSVFCQKHSTVPFIIKTKKILLLLVFS